MDCGALRRYTDVIVLPVTGSCSLASLLAGGGKKTPTYEFSYLIIFFLDVDGGALRFTSSLSRLTVE